MFNWANLRFNIFSREGDYILAFSAVDVLFMQMFLIMLFCIFQQFFVLPANSLSTSIFLTIFFDMYLNIAGNAAFGWITLSQTYKVFKTL